MPIAISIRRDRSNNVYRDTFIRALGSPTISSAYIASGFFSDISSALEQYSPDFVITPEMKGKKVFLFGAYNEQSKCGLLSLRDSLRAKGLQAYASVLNESNSPGLITNKWHAKIAVYHGEHRPVIAITGSSNLTSPIMTGSSEVRYFSEPHSVQIEADTCLWLKGDINAGQTMHDAFHYWNSYRDTGIAFNSEKYDDEVAKLIEAAYSGILKNDWKELP